MWESGVRAGQPAREAELGSGVDGAVGDGAAGGAADVSRELSPWEIRKCRHRRGDGPMT
jgi:hypothetical protein